jgi:hypothetical protein
MNTSDEKNSVVEPEEELFVQRALAKVERTVRFDTIEQIVVMLIVFPGAYYLVGHGSENPVPFTVILVIGLLLVAITVKLVGLINRNTWSILRAIADINRN